MNKGKNSTVERIVDFICGTQNENRIYAGVEMKKLPLCFLISVLVPGVCFADPPDSFWGTYQTGMDCRTSFLILNKENVSIDECKRVPYKIIECTDNQIVIDVLQSQACAGKTIKIEREEVQYKVESKGPRSDMLPTYTNFILSLYKSYENYSYNSPKQRRNYRKVDPSKADDQVVLFLNSQTSQQRKQALHEINLQCYDERDQYNEIGLRDPSPEIRGIAAFFLRGEPNHFVPILINVIANDPDAEVRASAGYSLKAFYTSNGSEGDLYINPLEDNLETLLKGLKKVETVRSVVDILGNGYTGDSFAPCFMFTNNREKVINALRNQLKSIRHQADDWKKGRATWSNELNEAEHEIGNAINNISQCNPTN